MPGRLKGLSLFSLGRGCQNRFGIPFWRFGEFTSHVRTYFSADWDVRWGFDLDFDPWPSGCFPFGFHLNPPK